MALNYVRWVERLNQQRVLRTEAGKRFIGAIGVLANELAEGASQAVRALWVGDRAGIGPAYDGLTPAGEELSLPKYPRESWAQYHARLQRAWDDWPYAGHESSILGQLAAAGFDDPGITIYHASDWPLSGRPSWWSQFWVYFPIGSHTVTADGPPIGPSLTVGSFVVGPVGLLQSDAFAMRQIILKFKPAHWICSGIVFQVSGWVVGTDPDVGDPGLVVGGETATVGVPY